MERASWERWPGMDWMFFRSPRRIPWAMFLRGGPWTAEERGDGLQYCQGDVEALNRLLPAMLPELDLPRAVLRGRYMAAVARMEAAGIPIDVETLSRLRESWETIQERLIREMGRGVYEGRSFRAERFERLLAHHKIAW